MYLFFEKKQCIVTVIILYTDTQFNQKKYVLLINDISFIFDMVRSYYLLSNEHPYSMTDRIPLYQIDCEPNDRDIETYYKRPKLLTFKS